MPTNLLSTTLKAIWPPSRRKAQKAKEAREQAAKMLRQAEQIKRTARERAEAEERRIRSYEAHIQAYKTHIKNVDLKGVGMRNGEPLTIDDLISEVEKRLTLARAVGRSRRMKLADSMSDADIEAITGHLDRTALNWLLEHNDPNRQRTAANQILNARAEPIKKESVHRYATVVGEAVARSSGLKFSSNRTVAAVIARAILLRSVDPQWERQRQGVMLSLTPLGSQVSFNLAITRLVGLPSHTLGSAS